MKQNFCIGKKRVSPVQDGRKSQGGAWWNINQVTNCKSTLTTPHEDCFIFFVLPYHRQFS